MGKIKKPEKVKLIVGMISSKKELFEKAIKQLQKKYGPVDFISNILLFDKTNYYEDEMGKNLRRQFISFKKLISPQDIIHIKRQTNTSEFVLSKNKTRRKINLDPGYVCAGKLVLATTKDWQHRIYLDKGIFAEVTLRYRGGTFSPYEWTYPDYQTPEYIKVFNRIREIYIRQKHRK